MADRTCTVEDCDDPFYCKGFCRLHYGRSRTGKPLTDPRQSYGRTGCTVPDCGEPHYCRDLCKFHYQRWYTGKPLTDPKQPYRRTGCEYPGCGSKHHANGYCRLHYERSKSGTVPMDAPVRETGTDDIGYRGAHVRVDSRRGKASDHTCFDCGDRAAHWSYNLSGVKERSETVPAKGGGTVVLLYSTDPDQYDPRCVPCHSTFDAR